jgi:hypothetical protein
MIGQLHLTDFKHIITLTSLRNWPLYKYYSVFGVQFIFTKFIDIVECIFSNILMIQTIQMMSAKFYADTCSHTTVLPVLRSALRILLQSLQKLT